MLKKSITFTDFNEDEVTEDFYFNLSKSELVKLEMSHKGGLEAALERIMRAEDGKTIMEEFENIILLTYGKRSDDGKRFIKNDKIREEFRSSAAYDVLFMELVTNAEKAAEFTSGVIPKDLAAEAAKIAKTNLKAVETPEVKQEPRMVTRAELLDMSADEFEALGRELTEGKAILENE